MNLGKYFLNNAIENNKKVREGKISNNLSKDELKAYNTGEIPNSPNYKKRGKIESLKERTQ